MFTKVFTMRSSTILASLGLATSAVAAVTGSRHSHFVTNLETRAEAAAQNLPAIKTAIQVGAKDAAALDEAVKALTAANVDTQSDVINKLLLQLAADSSDSAKKIGASGAVGVMEAMTLTSQKTQQEWGGLIKGLITSANSTMVQLQSKQEMISKAGKVDKVVPGIRAQKQAILDLMAIVPGQIPASVKGSINGMLKGSNSGVTGEPMDLDNLSKPATLEKYGKLIDSFLDQMIGNLKNGTSSYTLPPGTGAPGPAMMPNMAMPASAPAAPAAPVGSTAPIAPAPAKPVPAPAKSSPMSAKAAPKPKGGKGPGAEDMTL